MMSSSTSQLSIVLETTLALLGQFQIALSSTPAIRTTTTTTATIQAEQQQDALPLIVSSATALRAQVTKLSLLAISSPFTQSAITSVLKALNESVLPSLVTVSLLVTPTRYTRAFQTEIQVLSQIALKELVPLVEEVKRIAQSQDQQDSTKNKNKNNRKDAGGELPQAEKDVITTLTGRVWDACDALVDVAKNGVVGFVVKRVEEWRDLVRDAIEEIEEWDPGEEDDEADEFFDHMLGENGKNGAGGDEDDGEEDNNGDDGDTALALLAQKKVTVRFLKPIAQIYSTIVSNRLKRTGTVILPSSTNNDDDNNNNISKLDALMVNLQKIPHQVDEAAGALYEENIQSSIQRLIQAQEYATEAVRLVMFPWVGSGNGNANGKSNGNGNGENQSQASGSPPEDKFTVWSRTWLKVMDQVSQQLDV